jgi:hypothetical protein
MLVDRLKEEIASWETLGVPSLLQRFVVRNGKSFTPRQRIGHKRKAKMCFMNAAHFALDKCAGVYVEGYALNKKLPLMPIHHAWVTLDGEAAMDPTLDAEGYEYFGVVFNQDVLRRELLRSKRYGLLDTGIGLNHELMFKIDPELETIVNAIRRKDHEAGPQRDAQKFRHGPEEGSQESQGRG